MLEVFYAGTAGLDETRARVPGRSGRPGSAFAVSLLAHAVQQVCGLSLPAMAEDARGKPYFPELPELRFSYAHTGGLVLCALSDEEVGADAERRRPLRAGTASRFTGAESLTELDFFEAWTLMESAVKWGFRGNLLRFAPEAAAGLHYRHYALLGCAACVCSERRVPPEDAVGVDPGAICT